MALCFTLIDHTACSGREGDSASEKNGYPYLVSHEMLARVSVDEIKIRYPQGELLIAHAVRAYKIVYKTKGLDDNDMQASGLILLPESIKDELTILGYQHATIAVQEEAPSAYKPEGNQEAYIGATVAASLAAGYLVVMADYLGFGISNKIQHPYQEKASLSVVCLDMLRAAKDFANYQGFKVKKEIRLMGYSEGAYATMALHQRIEEQAKKEFLIAASYPAGGAYDMVGTAKWVVSQTTDLPDGATSFYLWTLYAYNLIYGLRLKPRDMIQPAYTTVVGETMMEGNPLETAVNNNPSELFTESFRKGIKEDSNETFLAILEQNNVYNWKPNGPITFFHAMEDDIVPVLNSRKAVETMTNLGGEVRFVSLGDCGHQEGANVYLTVILPLLAQL